MGLDADTEDERFDASGVEAQAGPLVEAAVVAVDAGFAIEIIAFLEVEGRALVLFQAILDDELYLNSKTGGNSSIEQWSLASN